MTYDYDINTVYYREIVLYRYVNLITLNFIYLLDYLEYMSRKGVRKT